MSLTPKTDYVDVAKARLPRKFRDKPRFESVIASMAETAQDAEAGLLTLYVPRFLANATGAILDVYGAIVGQARFGMDDTSYRLRIRARMILNRSSGTAEDLLRIARLLVTADNAIILREFFPAGVSLQVAGGATPLPDDVYAILYAAKAGGISFRLVTQDGPDAERFAFEGGTGLGFAGYPTDWLGPREDVTPVVLVPASVSPVTRTETGVVPTSLGPVVPQSPFSAGATPVVDFTGGTVPTGIGTVTIEMVDDVDFTWTSTGGYGGDQNISAGGGPGSPFELFDINMTAGTGIGINIAFGASGYAGTDSWKFTVTDSVTGTGASPTVALTPPVATGLGIIVLTFVSTMDFDWSNGTDGGQHNLTDGGPLGSPIELFNVNTGVGTGVFVTFPASESYVPGDAFDFTVTDATFLASTPPLLAITSPLNVTGRVTLEVVTGDPSYTFRYKRPDGTFSTPENMGPPAPLLNADASPMGLTVTWPDVPTFYAGAAHAWRAVESDSTAGGKFSGVR